MTFRAAWAIARKDLKIFFRDRRALLLSVAAPIAIATFFGFLFSGERSSDRTRIPVLVADEDRGEVSRSLVRGLEGDEALEVVEAGAPQIRETVRRGKATVGLLIPRGFGDAAVRALFQGGAKPELSLLYDPSHWGEMGMVRGLLTQHVLEAVTREAFGGPAGRRSIGEALSTVDSNENLPPDDRKALRRLLESVASWQERLEAQPRGESSRIAGGLAVPFQSKEEAVTSGSGVTYNAYAHSFAGMGVQFILFAAIELGVGILLERQRGLWKRLRAAPLSRFTLLTGKALGGTVTGLFALTTTFAFAIFFLGVRIQGSATAFLLLCLAVSLMSAAFGLMIAALGRTPAAARGLSVLAVLLLTMLGGGWVPAFLFPAWMQKLTLAIPTRWAVDGLDGVTWRGFSLAETLPAVGVLLLFTLAFGLIALWKFRWED